MQRSIPIADDQKDRLCRFVQFAGLPADSVRFVRAARWAEVSASMHSADSRAMAVELAFRPGTPAAGEQPDWSPRAAGPRHVLLFGTGLCEHRSQAPSQGPGMHPRGSTEAPAEVRFSDDDLWGPVAGLAARWAGPEARILGGALGIPDRWHCLLSIGNEPWFGWRKTGGSAAFLWAAAQLPDLREPLDPAEEWRGERLLPCLPLLAFLRAAFGQKVWHAPAAFANLTIDDPPVRDRYGFFAPARHLSSLAHVPHATTIAFIPWNWKRSTPAAAAVFRSNPDRLSLCVHGCDHTGGEFASSDQATLDAKCRLALQRVETLRGRTGLSCEPVMVFPQGEFSRAAMAALRETGFVGAANSTLFPVDSEPGEICIADLLEPAFTGIEDFPIFFRRYPKDPALCAVDLFLGRPLLLVEHQEFFRDDHAACRQFLETINRFKCPPMWVPLDRVVRRACLQREMEPDKFEVRFYSNRFVLENAAARARAYRVTRRWHRPDRLVGIVVNGQSVPYRFADGHIAFCIELGPHSAATVDVLPNRPRGNGVFKGSPGYRARVFARRRLCDLRDNHPWIAECARWVKRLSR